MILDFKKEFKKNLIDLHIFVVVLKRQDNYLETIKPEIYTKILHDYM